MLPLAVAVTPLGGVAATATLFFLAVVGPEPAAALNNGLALTPPMGFANWNGFGCHYNDTTFRQQADYLNSSGMAAAGYRTMIIQECITLAGHRAADGLAWSRCPTKWAGLTCCGRGPIVVVLPGGAGRAFITTFRDYMASRTVERRIALARRRKSTKLSLVRTSNGWSIWQKT